MKPLVIILIKFYQYTLSPLTGRNCRYYPTCSSYALEAVKKYGSLKGSMLAFKRVVRCHPFNSGGYDPVP